MVILNTNFSNILYLEGMTLEEFYDLDEMEQREIVWENGEFLHDRMDEEKVHRVALYQIFSFYVLQSCFPLSLF
jgi:hypothetical protein